MSDPIEQNGIPQKVEEATQEVDQGSGESSAVSELRERLESAAAPSAEEFDAVLSTVPDPALVDIDKLIDGEIALVPEGEDTATESVEMADTKHSKKNKKKSKDVVMDQLQTAMKSLPAEEQINVVMSKYSELAENNRQLQQTVKTIQKQVESVHREKEHMETEHSKVVLTKSRLESLCRELQKQNKLIKDENVTRLKEEEERRKEVSAKFNTTLSEISNLMKENSDKNNKLRDENQDMSGRLTDLVKQYESRELHVEKILKAKDLQCQLAEAKLAKQHIEVTESKEKMLLEKKALLEDISSYQTKMQTMSETEINLRTQLNSYMEKYEEFQTTLDRSNKVFTTFKKEMDEMTKKIKKLEKETKTWKERWEGANKALLDMVSERSELEKKMETQGRQNIQLQNLCRALQEQVTELRKQNKSSSSTEVQADILDEVLVTQDASTETVTAVTENISEIEISDDEETSETRNDSTKETQPESQTKTDDQATETTTNFLDVD